MFVTFRLNDDVMFRGTPSMVTVLVCVVGAVPGGSGVIGGGGPQSGPVAPRVGLARSRARTRPRITAVPAGSDRSTRSRGGSCPEGGGGGGGVGNWAVSVDAAINKLVTIRTEPPPAGRQCPTLDG